MHAAALRFTAFFNQSAFEGRIGLISRKVYILRRFVYILQNGLTSFCFFYRMMKREACAFPKQGGRLICSVNDVEMKIRRMQFTASNAATTCGIKASRSRRCQIHQPSLCPPMYLCPGTNTHTNRHRFLLRRWHGACIRPS